MNLSNKKVIKMGFSPRFLALDRDLRGSFSDLLWVLYLIFGTHKGV